jgi:cyanophycinase
MKKLFSLTLMIIALIVSSCKSPNKTENIANKPKGILYIIGGGDKDDEMVQQMIDISGAKNGKYIIVLPMASSEPDSASYYAHKQFLKLGATNIKTFNFTKGGNIHQSRIDSMVNSGMIYICGGDQSVFMNVVLNTPIYTAIHDAYYKGAMIAGTSAGAAVMSKKMITGNQIRYPKAERYSTIVTKNIEVTEGLGLLQDAIIDQHFIKRARLNRLVSVCIENPQELCIGIDESTAILVKGDSATVCGESQVIVLNGQNAEVGVLDTLLKANNIKLDILLKGEKFRINK